jgi:hypothetical protein
MSKLAVIGLVAGGAAGAGAAVVLSQKAGDPPPAGTVSAITLSQAGGVQAATAFSFSVQVTGFDVSSTTYRWEFGDGQASTDAAPTHTYDSAGTFSVAVTVRDARQSIRSETPVTVYSITGTWIDPNASTAGSATLQLTQSGTTITGVASWETGAGNLPYSPCPLSGSVQPGTPVLILLNQPTCPHPRFGPLVPMDYRLMMTVGGQMLSGSRETPNVNGPPLGGAIRLTRQ